MLLSFTLMIMREDDTRTSLLSNSHTLARKEPEPVQRETRRISFFWTKEAVRVPSKEIVVRP